MEKRAGEMTADEMTEFQMRMAEEDVQQLEEHIRRYWPKMPPGSRFLPIRKGEQLQSPKREFWRDVRLNVPRHGVRIHKDGYRETFPLSVPMSGRQLRKYRKFLNRHHATPRHA